MKKKTGRSFVKYANWPGVVTGFLMVIVSFMGSWWRVQFGDGFIEMAVSPFYYEAVFMGEEISIPLLSYLLPAVQALLIIGGFFMIIGSLFNYKDWSEKLSKFGFRKIFWPLLTFIIILLVGTFLTNNFMGEFLPGDNQEIDGMDEGLDIEAPYVVGSGDIDVDLNELTASVPIEMSLTSGFWMALVAVILGIFSRKFYPDLVKREDRSSGGGFYDAAETGRRDMG